ncbi:hypothetical protein J6590_046029 [Homalodisca vitripennis]|nr:hypothetical protein J6590_017167 [Homalodisca vitripennis]KAG8277285.1 hypothetical protein J6590_046029 [Homalodisca vitripennis]
MAGTGFFLLVALLFVSFFLHHEGNCLPLQPMEGTNGKSNISSLHNAVLDSREWWKNILKAREMEDKLREKVEVTSPKGTNGNKNITLVESENEPTLKSAHATDKTKGTEQPSVITTEVTIHNPETLATPKIKSTSKEETNTVKNGTQTGENGNQDSKTIKSDCKSKECSPNTAQERCIFNLFANLMLLGCSFYWHHMF